MNFRKISVTICITLFCLMSVDGQISRPVQAVSALEVTDRLLVNVLVSDRSEMIIEGQDAEHVQAIFKNGQLRLKMAAGHNLQGGETMVTLYTTNLSKIDARKGAVVNVENSTLHADAMSFAVREGGKIRALIEAIGVDVLANTGGAVDLLGRTVKLNVSTTAGGSFYGKDLETEIAHVRVSGGGRTEVHATQSADVQTRLGGVIDVYGTPAERRDKTVLGGEINFH